MTDLAHLDFVEHVFLPEAIQRRLVGFPQDAALQGLVRELVAEAGAAAPPTRSAVASAADSDPASGGAYQWPGIGLPPAAAPTSFAELERRSVAPQVPPPPAASTRLAPPLPSPPPSAPVAPRPPSPLRQWWSRTVRAIGSDLAVHGLAYLGVLLFFVGAFGLVAFAFADVATGLRPVAEVVIAAAPFAAGALLRRRRAEAVGRSLELAGGLVLPIMLVTSLLDEVAFPPDLSGIALVVTLTLLMAALALGYAAWSRRHPASALRFLLAPVGWLAVGLATMGVGREIPSGKAVATPSAVQVAAMAVALTLTLVWLRFRPHGRFVGPTTTSALPAVGVLAGLAVLTWASDGWPPAVILVSGTALLAAAELLGRRLSALIVGLLQPAWWAVVWVALSGPAATSVGQDAVNAVAAVGFVVILELAAARRRPGISLGLPAVGAALALASTLSGDPRWAAGVLAAAGVWAMARRTAPFPAPRAAALLDLAAVVLPLAALAALIAADDTGGGAVAVLVAAVVLLAAAVPAGRGWLERSPEGRFGRLWWSGGLVVVVVLCLSLWDRAPGRFELWSGAVALALLMLGALVGPLSAVARPVVATALGAGSWLMATQPIPLSEDLRWTVLAVGGLALVALTRGLPTPADTAPDTSGYRRQAAAATGLAGHLLGAVTVVAAHDTRWGLVGVAAAATAAWWVTGWREVRGISPVGAALRTVQPSLADLPLVLAAIGVPVTFSLLLDRTGLLPLTSPWSAAVLSVLGAMYAAVAGLPMPARVGRALSRVGFLLAVTAPLFTTERMPAVLGLAALIAAVAVMPREHRIAPMTWSAWIAPAPIVHLLGAELWPRPAWLTESAWTALALVSVGAVLLLGGLAARRRPALRPVPWTGVTLAIGALEVAAAFAMGVVDQTGLVAGWLCAAVALVVLLAGVLSRLGVLGGVAVALGWWATLLLAGPQIAVRPWLALVVSATLLLVAYALSVLAPTPAGTTPANGKPQRWWGRWDAPVLVAAAPVAATALLLGVGTPAESLCWTAAGVQSLAVAAGLRRHPSPAVALGVLGTALVLLGAGAAGSGWLALALLVQAVALTVLGTRVAGSAGLACRAGGAVSAVAAAAVALDWFAWSPQRSVDTAALAAATVIAVITVLARVVPDLDRAWWLSWGGAAAVVEAVLAITVLTPPSFDAPTASWPVTAGLVVTASALALAATPVGLGWLREGAAAYLLVGFVVALGAAALSMRAASFATSAVGAGTAVALLAASSSAWAEWRRPLLVLGVPATAWALVAGATAGHGALAVPLAVASLQAAATGVVWRRPGLQMLSPAFACAAWLAFAFEALDPRPEWVTAPAGFAALVAVALWRRDRALRGQAMIAPEVVVLELAGIALIVGPSLASAVTVGPGHAVAALVLGLAVAGWGVVTEVRRRVAAGVATVLLAVLLLVAVPLVDLLPQWQGAALWVLIAGVGLVAVLAAAFVERGKVMARKGLAQLAEATAGWE
ncbi:MAG TPA: hypothetical protein VFM07_08350 [Intrasporangium sp.]|nr:hypothetical protein [Intrasporangium sp.]